MDAADVRVARLYPDWPRYAARIVDAVSPLSAEQLDLRVATSEAPVWAIAAHIAGARTYWLCGVFGEPGAERTPFSDPFADGWEDDLTHPRTAGELAWALGSTWTVVADCLERWRVEALGETAERRWGDTIQVHTRASVLNRLAAHDAFHAGEISLLLGANGVGDMDLWRRPAP
jgi:uncharacterized damage-inducible protein DinB